MRTTIKDIARETGLSVSTVSLALSDRESRVSQATRQLVRNAARKLNYRPNQLASSLITRKTKMLGIVLPDISNVFFAKMAKGAGHEADANNYDLMLFDTNDNPDKDVRAIEALLERGADGILLACAVAGHYERLSECLEICRNAGVPIVLADRCLDHIESHSVMIDQELGGYLATRHLLDLGHRRISCVTGPMADGSLKKRFYGYIKALQEEGIPLDSSLVAESNYLTADCGYALAKSLLSNKTTAIFAFNDLIAFGVYRYLKEIKLDVPRDISLIGFDDIYCSRIIDKPLSTIRQPVYEIGREAVSKLIKMINQEPVEMRTLFHPELIVRETTAQYDKGSHSE